MSDRPEESRPSSEAAGGWFVPKNAMTEQQIAASNAQSSDSVPMPDSATPQKTGDWYVPQGAEARAAEVSQPAQQAKAPVNEQQPGKKDLPQGAALSSEVDYSNYVPGKGFVPKSESEGTPGSTSPAPAVPEPAPTGPQKPIDEPAVASGGTSPAPAKPEVSTATSQQPAAQGAAVYGTQAQAAQASQPNQPAGATGPQAPASGTGASKEVDLSAAKPVNPELVQRYGEVEQSVQVLRRRYSAGSITRDQLQAELRKLMILDEEGYWWMIGLE